MKDRSSISITAGILAGGKSSRMGTCKSLLNWHGSTFLAHTVALFSDFSQCLVSVDQKEKFKDVKLPDNPILVEDEKKEYGPLEGIYRLLLAAEEEKVFVVATDMPMLTKDFIHAFVNADMGQADVVIAVANEKYHPLCGIYKKSCIPVIEQMFEKEKHSIRALLEETRSILLNVEELGFTANIVSNVNTEQEYKNIKRSE